MRGELAVLVASQDAALVFDTPRAFFEPGGARGLERDRQRYGFTEHFSYRGLHELIKRDHDRDRIAGQAKEAGAAEPAEGQRAARLHRDLPECHLAPRAERLFNIIGLAHRDPAGGDHDIGLVFSPQKGAIQQCRVIPDDAEVDDFHAEPRQHAIQGIAVAVIDQAVRERLAYRAQLIAGREKGHLDIPADLDLGQAHGGQHAQIGGRQPRAFGEHPVAPRQVFAGLAHVVPRLDARADTNAPGGSLGLFLHDHAVRARRHERAGHNARALAGAEAAGERLARETRADQPQGRRTARRQGGGVDRITVHGRITAGRDIDPGLDIRGQHPPQCRTQRHGFRLGDRLDRGKDLCQRPLRQDRGRVKIIPATRASFNVALIHCSFLISGPVSGKYAE